MLQIFQPVEHPMDTDSQTSRELEARIRVLDAEVVSLRDERLQQLEEKERVADRLARLLEALPAGVVVLDGTGTVSEANPVAVSLLGEPLVGSSWREVIARAFHLDLSHSEPMLADGRLINLQTCPLGQEPGQILLLQEVTEIRRAQERMEQMRRLADMGRMAATLAHQIRTPLASALLYTSQLNRPLIPEEKRAEFAAKAVGRLHDLEKLINDMLAFSRGNIGKGEPVAPRASLEAAIEPFREICSSRRINLHVEDCSRCLLMHANPTLLNTALQNLIHNAVTHISDGGSIQLLATIAENDVIDLIVQDNGSGVPEEIRGTLFEPFATTRPDGNGLGLAVVRAIARAHGGDAWFEPVFTGGSRFGLRLPAITRTQPGIA